MCDREYVIEHTAVRHRFCFSLGQRKSDQGQTVGDGGAQSQGVSKYTRQPSCQTRQWPHALELKTSEQGFVSLTSGSRAHDAGQAITPQG
jgi:hypothetical protein